jgi:hypothetical protein
VAALALPRLILLGVIEFLIPGTFSKASTALLEGGGLALGVTAIMLGLYRLPVVRIEKTKISIPFREFEVADLLGTKLLGQGIWRRVEFSIRDAYSVKLTLLFWDEKLLSALKLHESLALSANKHGTSPIESSAASDSNEGDQTDGDGAKDETPEETK